MNTPLLSVKDLQIDFKTENGIVQAIKGVSFEIRKGESVAVVGESGSGKTVTSLAALGLLPQAAIIRSGQIFFYENGKSENLIGLKERELSHIRGNKISMVFQEPMTSLNPVKTCGHQVTEAIIHHKKITGEAAKSESIALFEKVKLPDPETTFRKYPHELSGGQKQRVMIAMAVSCAPQILIADEPTTALDVTVQKSIIRLLKELQDSMGMSILYITHDLGLVKEISDRVIVMYRGEIVEAGITEDIFTNPQKNYTKALLSCHPRPEYKGKPLPVISDFLEGATEIKVSKAIQPTQSKSILSEEVLVEVRDLVIRFPLQKNFLGKTTREYTAVDHISFDIKKGETVGLVGESGCGKTTTGRALLRLIRPDGGYVKFGGKLLDTLSEEKMRSLRKDIQIIFQDPYGSLNPRITIGEAIREPLTIHHLGASERERKDRAIHLLERVGLNGDYYNRYPHEFSGGQRQRICIARALTLNPDFIVCDESVSALDVSVQAQVLNLLSELKEEFGFTSIFISHDLSVVHYISDRILVMRRGKIVESGTANQVFFNPREAYTRELIEAIPGRSFFNKN